MDFKMVSEMSEAERLDYYVGNICNTSIADAKHTIANAKKDVLEKALAYEQSHTNRKSLLKFIQVKINKLEKNAATA